MNGEAQYVADSFLIERAFQVFAELENGKGPISKYAFDLGSVIGSLGESIKSFVQSQIHGQDEGGVTRTVLNFLAPAVFFRLHPVLGILVTGAQLFGFDLYSIYQRIINAISPKIQSGQQVSAQEINDIAKQSIPTTSVTASDDLLESLRALHKEGSLTKEGVSSWQAANKANPFIPPKGAHPLLRAFSFLGPQRGGSLIVGILVWFLKTVLLSAGLLAVGGAATSVLGLGTETPKQEEKKQDAIETQPVAMPISTPAPNSVGSWNYKPNKGDIWIEDLHGQQPHERLLQWTIESYPDLNQYKDIIVRTPSFWNVIRNISQNWRPGQQQLAIPEPYKTRNEILALFINDVYGMVNQTRGT